MKGQYIMTTKPNLQAVMGIPMGKLNDFDKRIQALEAGSGGTVGPGTINEIAYFDTTTSIASLAVATYPSLTELSYGKGVTSAIQTQLNAKQGLDTQLTSLAALSYAGNGSKFIRLNAGETDFEFATVAGSGTVTDVSSANADISVATGTTTPVLTLNSATTPTASTIVKRDASANIYVNNYFANTASTVSAGGTTTLTVASARTQNLTGSSNQTYQLPDATTLALSSIFEFNNNSSGSLTITNAGAVSQYVVPAGGAVICYCTSIGSANGTWDFHTLAPTVTTWSSGVTGLIMNSVLATSPRIGSGASSSTAPSFIPQRGASTTGFGGDGTDLHATIAGTARLTISATGITATNLSGTNTGDQTITNSSDATSHTVTLSASGGSIQLIEGSNITLTTGGTGSAGTVTIAATGGSGDMVLASAQTNSGIKTFLDTTMKLRNVANTFDGYFVNTNTADRIYTLPNVAGTVALGTGTTNEIAYWSGTNTLGSLATATYPSLTELSYVKGVTSAIQTQINTKATSSGALTQFIGNGNWKVFYSDGSGDVTELALGASGTVLQSNGATSAPTFTAPAGSFDYTQVLFAQVFS